MKKKGMEEDTVRLLTINTSTGKVSKRMLVGAKRVFIDLERCRCHVPGAQKYQYKHLGVGWNDCELNVEDPSLVIVLPNWRVRFAQKIWEGVFCDDFDSGNGDTILLNIKDLTRYVGQGKWKKI